VKVPGEGAVAAVEDRPKRPNVDERVRDVGRLRRLLLRPEPAVISSTAIAWIVFAIWAGATFTSWAGTVSYLEVGAQLAIVAVPVGLLMIAGEFDISIGSMIGAAGMLIVIPIVEWGWGLPEALLLALVGGIIVGLINGALVIRTGLPSFIVTLATFFALRGLTLVLTRSITGSTQVGGIDEQVSRDSFLYELFGGKIGTLPVSVLWAVAITIVATIVLLRTRFGNWIFGAGGDANAARRMGVPVARVKVLLFITTAVGATLLAAIQVLSVGSADVLRGQEKEFQAIAAAVIGGTLLTGGYGSAIGVFFGAILFGMVEQGIFFTGTDSDWFKVFLGGILLAAVLVNRLIQRRASGSNDAR
jgi:simple sugar transport system permease protein